MDIIQARKHLEEYQAEINKYQSLSREGILVEELMFIDRRIRDLKQRIANIRQNLNAK